MGFAKPLQKHVLQTALDIEMEERLDLRNPSRWTIRLGLQQAAELHKTHKHDPETFLKALKKLNRDYPWSISVPNSEKQPLLNAIEEDEDKSIRSESCEVSETAPSGFEDSHGEEDEDFDF